MREENVDSGDVQDDCSTISSTLTGDDQFSQISGPNQNEQSLNKNDSRNRRKNRNCRNSFNSISKHDNQDETSTNDEDPWCDVPSDQGQNEDLSSTSTRTSVSPNQQFIENCVRSDYNEVFDPTDSGQPCTLAKAEREITRRSVGRVAGVEEIVSATDKSSYPSDQDIRINNNLYLDRDSVQDMGGYTTREDNSSSTTSVVGERFGDGNNAKRSKDTLYVLAQQSHRYDRSKDKRMIEWGAQSTELRGVGWSNTDCGESDSSGDSGGLALGISRNTDASTGQVSQKRALTRATPE